MKKLEGRRVVEGGGSRWRAGTLGKGRVVWKREGEAWRGGEAYIYIYIYRVVGTASVVCAGRLARSTSPVSYDSVSDVRE